MWIYPIRYCLHSNSILCLDFDHSPILCTRSPSVRVSRWRNCWWNGKRTEIFTTDDVWIPFTYQWNTNKERSWFTSALDKILPRTTQVRIELKSYFFNLSKHYCVYLYWHWTWDSFLFRYYSEGFQAVEHFGNYITELTGKLSDIRQIQDDEKTDLIEVRNSLKNSPGLEKMVRHIWWKERNYVIT